jgi:hypothetical protein
LHADKIIFDSESRQKSFAARAGKMEPLYRHNLASRSRALSTTTIDPPQKPTLMDSLPFDLVN